MSEQVEHSSRAECTVSKTQLLRFFEAKFQTADRDHDGQLNVTELSNFLRFVTHPDLRMLRAWDKYADLASTSQRRPSPTAADQNHESGVMENGDRIVGSDSL
jgi:hypothetical protein